jgi:hypothetical protein
MEMDLDSSVETNLEDNGKDDCSILKDDVFVILSSGNDKWDNKVSQYRFYLLSIEKSANEKSANDIGHVSREDVKKMMQALPFKSVGKFADTFYHVVDLVNRFDLNRQDLLLRTRFNISKNQSMKRVLSQPIPWGFGSHHVKKLEGEEKIFQYLKKLGVSQFFLQEVNARSSFSFSFERFVCVDQRFGVIYVDVISDDIAFITFKIENEQQWHNILNPNVFPLNIPKGRQNIHTENDGGDEFYVFQDHYLVSVKTDVDAADNKLFFNKELLDTWDQSAYPTLLYQQELVRETFYDLKTEKEKRMWENQMGFIYTQIDDLPEETKHVYQQLLDVFNEGEDFEY